MKTPVAPVSRRTAVPLNRQVIASFRDAIASGRLAPGERILSSRELVRHLGVSRNTVMDALAQLHSEGYLVTVRGVGTFVADGVATRTQPSVSAESPPFVPPPLAAACVAAEPLAENLRHTTPFRPGMPALDLFPATQFARCFRRGEWTPGLLDYGDPLGYAPLRAAIARRLQQTRGLACDPGNIVITTGAQTAFAQLVRAVVKRGDRVVVEDPGYPSLRAILEAHGARVDAVAVDGAGIDVDAFARRPARFAYVTPSHQYPGGAVLSLQRRLALLEWAERHDAWIVEDDYDSEFNYTGRVQPALHALAGGGRVIYAGTFSKVLSPSLRVAYLVLPERLVPAVRALQNVCGGEPATIVQAALAHFVADGHLGRHVTRVRKIYDERRRFVAAELAAGGWRVRDSRAGLHFIVELPPGTDDVAASARARAAGIVAPPLSRYGVRAKSPQGLVIGFATAPPAQARAAVTQLRAAVAGA